MDMFRVLCTRPQLVSALFFAFCTQGALSQCGPGNANPYPPGQTVCPSGPPGGGAPGGGDSGAPVSTSAHAAAMLGDVAVTTASGTDARTGVTFPIGENIYGPFEAGFGTQQNNILESLGCSAGSLGHLAGGIDTQTAEQMVAHQCTITLPRIVGNTYVSLLDECGGHTQEYHFHEKMTCLYAATGGHSTKVGQTTGGQSLYGKWENADSTTLPQLDACGAHFGRTPESPTADVYHYHVQDKPPFTIGCFGPNDDNTVVTVAQCRSFYTGCDGNGLAVTLPTGTVQYDDWCPCFDAAGSNANGAVMNTVTVASGTAASAASLGARSSPWVLAWSVMCLAPLYFKSM